jgi:hypothetical protein
MLSISGKAYVCLLDIEFIAANNIALATRSAEIAL